MPDLLIEDLDPDLVERLRLRAEANDRSLEEEVKGVLAAAAKRPSVRKFSPQEALEISKEWHRRLAGQIHGDSADLIREDRER